MKKVLGPTLFALAIVALTSVEGNGADDKNGPKEPEIKNANAPAGPAVPAGAIGHAGLGGHALLHGLGVPAGDPCAGAGGVIYMDKVITCYRAEARTRTIYRTVSRVVTREVEQQYTYAEMVPVTTMQRQTRTVYRTVTRQVPYTYTV